MKTALTTFFKRWLPAMVLAVTLGGATATVAAPQTASAACSEQILTFPAWYKGLLVDSAGDDCNVKNPAAAGGLPAFLFKIALNVIEMLLQLAAYIAAAFILIGGFKYLTSTGTAEDIVKARKTILNAVIGLVISLFSVAIVNVVAGTF